MAPKPHRAPEIAALRSPFKLIAAQPLGHEADDRLTGGAEFRRIGVGNADEIARSLDHGHLHAEADAEIRHVALACELGRTNFPLGAALAESARHQNAIDV